MKRILINGNLISESGLKMGATTLFETRSLVSTELQPDEFNFIAYGDKTSEAFLVTEGEFEVTEGIFYVGAGADVNLQAPYGTQVSLYDDQTLIGTFYVRESAQIAPNTYSFSCFSEIGLLVYLKYFGGIYSGATAGAVVADIMGTLPYTIDPDVASVPIYGHIPICDKRTALQNVCFAVGANVFRAADGSILIKFNRNYSADPISPSKIYMDGRSLSQKTYATTVNVTEWGYFQLGTEEIVTLFDNTGGAAAVSRMVEFDSPCYNLATTGSLVIDNSGANYAVVSGTGTLTGQKYTITQQVLSATTNSTALESREINSSECHLVSSVNSRNVLARLSAFYATESELQTSFVMDDEICGYPYSLPDIFGNTRTGFLAECDSTFSSIRKGNGKFITDWTPSNFGNNFSNYVLLTGSGTWNVPAGVTALRVVLGSGGAGGSGGHGGESSGYYNVFNGWTKNAANKGGAAGDPGMGGKVLIVDIDSPAASYSYTCGAGGAGGFGGTADDATPPTLGADGGDTTFGAYSSASGVILESGYINPLSTNIPQDRYSYAGGAGYAGADGKQLISGGQSPTIGDDFTDGITTWTGGAAGTGSYSSYRDYGYGGSGGGAAYGANGGDAGNGGFSSGYYFGGYGGAGASATAPAAQTQFGCGGAAGNGAGGGGYPGLARTYQGSGYEDDYGSGAAGAGGSGSAGGIGGNGYIIVFY